MTRAELRLELLRIVHNSNRDHKLTLEIVHHYEEDFQELLDGGAEGAGLTKTHAAPKKATKGE